MRAGFVFLNAFLGVLGIQVGPWSEAVAALLVKAQPAGVATPMANDLVLHRRVCLSTQGLGGT
jgi:hypothetical protein